MLRRAPWLALLLASCSPGGDPPPSGCSTGADCDEGEICIDGACRPEGSFDAGPRDAGPGDGRDAGPGAEDAGRCGSTVLCGGACCAPGEECVGTACLAACGSGVRCGPGRAVCCGDGQVCLAEDCVDPGDACADSFDCPMGSFCEPTLGRCLPQLDPVTCETTPVFGAFEAVEEWSVRTAVTRPDCLHSISSPIVIDLDGDAVPEVVANMACDDDWQRGVLRAVRGTDGSPVWTVAALELNGRSSIGAGDLDGDGRPEIVAMAVPSVGRAYAFGPDGSLRWQSTDAAGAPLTISCVNCAPTLADLDMDGSPEVIIGAVVLDAAGALVWQRDSGGAEGTNDGYTGGISAVADIDMDGMPEVVSGRRAYEHDGAPKWTASAPDGYPAIAQLDADPQPEVVLVGSGAVRILDGLTGALEWGPQTLPGGGRGGPPTIADFDGDGRPEIGVAGAGSYSVYDPDGAAPVLWSRPTEDVSSNATGSSVFDFEGDGAAEVVYADECYMRVYRGTDGEVLLQIPNSTATIHEYPLVADVDADGNSEIVIVANDRAASIRDQCRGDDPAWDGARRGLFVYGDVRDQWVGTRRLWNQHAYHVTNVGSDGRVPAAEVDNWSVPGLNNYRQNSQGDGVFNAPDLTVVALSVDLAGCPVSAVLQARVANEGSLGVPAGVPVAFRAGTPAAPGALLGVAPTTVPLLPGATTLVTLEVALEGDPPYAFVATVDDDGTGAGVVTECDEDDNAAAIADVDCAILL